MMDEGYDMLSRHDRSIFLNILGCWRLPDADIRPNDKPYLFRWHVIPRNPLANVYLHIQVDDDPRSELHDHPWDNTSVILSGGYTELLNPTYGHIPTSPGKFVRSPGDMIFRRAAWSHQLLMSRHPYTMTLFSTGPHIREWGYWFPDGWHHNKRHNVMENGKSTFREEG